MKALRRFLSSVRADYGSVQAHRAKYSQEHIPLSRLPLDLVRKIGFQMMVAVRIMRLFREWHLPLAPQLVSRIIRHLYAAEIHWEAEIADGISLVHGVGLVISHAARVGPHCILFHNVTLGQSMDPLTRVAGAPTLEARVHVGPGAVLLGPITVGTGTKIMAGCVLDRSVPPGSVVRPAPITIAERAPRPDNTPGQAPETIDEA